MSDSETESEWGPESGAGTKSHKGSESEIESGWEWESETEWGSESGLGSVSVSAADLDSQSNQRQRYSQSQRQRQRQREHREFKTTLRCIIEALLDNSFIYEALVHHGWLQTHQKGHRISFQMVVRNHVVGGIWTQYLWTSSQCSSALSHVSNPEALSLETLNFSRVLCISCPTIHRSGMITLWQSLQVRFSY